MSFPELASITCPACDGASLIALGAIDPNELIAGYQKYFGIQVAYLFNRLARIDELHCSNCDLIFFVPPIAGGERFYAELGQLPWYYMPEKPEFSIAAGFITGGARVLEIGCGHGAFSSKLDSADYTGLEFSPAAAASAREAGVDVRQQSIEEHALTRAGYYDVVCSFQVLEHTPRPRAFVESMARCVRSGGRLILSVPSEDGFGGVVINDLLNLPPHHLTRWSDRALTGLGVRLGLTHEALVPEPVASYHYGRYALARITSILPLGLRGKPGRRLVTRGIRYQLWRVLAAVSQAVARKFPSLIQSMAEHTQTRGHTVVAVFRKN